MTNQQRKNLERKYNLALAVTRLQSNPDFLLLMQDIQLHRPAEATKLLSGLVKNNESINTVVEELKSLSFLQSYLDQLVNNGNSAKESLEQEDA